VAYQQIIEAVSAGADHTPGLTRADFEIPKR
jgi:hypothetical protein